MNTSSRGVVMEHWQDLKKVVLKDNVMLTSKLWDGYHVNTVSVDNIKFIICEYWENGHGSNNSNKSPRLFKLKAEVSKVDIKMNLFGSKKKTVFTNQYIKQFGILVNTATTGHKLQGLSMDYIIIVSWFYGAKNWVYVVLSRVRTLRGLYLFKPLDYDKYFKEDNKLKKHMKELEEIERQTLSSIEKLPKTSSLPRQEPSTTSRPITGDVLLNSKAKRGNNNKRNRTQSMQTSSIALKKKNSDKSTADSSFTSTPEFNIRTDEQNVLTTSTKPQYILDQSVWGSLTGAHSLP